MNLSDETKILKMAEVFSKTSTDVQSTIQVQAPLVIDTSIAVPVVVASTEPHLIDDVETAFDLAGESLLASDVTVDGGHTAPSVTLDELMTGTTLEGDMSIGELSALAEQIQANAFQSVPVVETSALPSGHIVAPVVELQSGAIEFCM
jgi:hypothetical protein